MTVDERKTQRDKARQNANEARSAMAALRKQLKAGMVGIDEAILTTDLNIPVERLLRSAPRIGRTKADVLLSAVRLRSNRPVASLTDRERQELVKTIGERYPKSLVKA